MRLRDKYDFDEIARRLTEARTQEAGRFGFRGFLYENVRSVLESCIEFQPGIPDIDARKLVGNAMHAAIRTPEVTKDVIISAMREEEAKYLRRPLEDLVVASGMRMYYFPGLADVAADDATLLFAPVLPPSFDRKPVQDLVRQHVRKELLSGGLTVCVTVPARTPPAAQDAGSRRLDLLRGIWNLQLNRSTVMRRSSDLELPVNAILPGPYQTVHKPDGTLADVMIWYDAEIGVGRIAELRSEWGPLRRWERRVAHRLKSCQYREELEALLVRYTQALDVGSHEFAFGRLWGVLEHLVGAVGDYKALVPRVGYLFGDTERAYTIQIVQHLRDVRNGLVHEARARGAMETYLYQLKMFVERAFLFHLARASVFASLREAGEFLDLPADRGLLRARARLLQRALRYRKTFDPTDEK